MPNSARMGARRMLMALDMEAYATRVRAIAAIVSFVSTIVLAWLGGLTSNTTCIIGAFNGSGRDGVRER